MTEYLLDTMVASRIMRRHRSTLGNMRRSGATSLGISVMTMSEMLYGALLRTAAPTLLAETRFFFARVDVFNWTRISLSFTPGFEPKRRVPAELREPSTL